MSNEDFVVTDGWAALVSDAQDVPNTQLHRIVPHVVFRIPSSEDPLGFLDHLARVADGHCGPKRNINHSAGGRNQLSVSKNR